MRLNRDGYALANIGNSIASKASFLLTLNDWYPAREITILGVPSLSQDSAMEPKSKLEDAAKLFK